MSNTLLAQMRNSKVNEYAAYMHFSLEYKKYDDNILHCFFEGYEDKRYYGLRIKFEIGQTYKVYTCNGIDRLLKVSELISQREEYKDAKTLYFADKDYSNRLTSNDLYVTPYYSIENFYVKVDVIKQILVHEFNMIEDSTDFINAIEKYNRLQSKYHQKLTFFNSWLACQHDYKVENNMQTNLKIDKTVKNYFNRNIITSDFEDIVEFNDLNDHNYIEKELFTDAPRIDIDSLELKKNEYMRCKHSDYFRGKFELIFFISYFTRIKELAGSKTSSFFQSRYKCSTRFEIATAISSFSQYAETPDCLIKYLLQFKN